MTAEVTELAQGTMPQRRRSPAELWPGLVGEIPRAAPVASQQQGPVRQAGSRVTWVGYDLERWRTGKPRALRPARPRRLVRRSVRLVVEWGPGFGVAALLIVVWVAMAIGLATEVRWVCDLVAALTGGPSGVGP